MIYLKALHNTHTYTRTYTRTQTHRRTRVHLLSQCPKTAPLRENFMKKLAKDHPEKFKEFRTISPNDRWLWILGGGVIPQPKRKPDYRTHQRKTVFQKGKTINLPKDEKKETTVEDCLEPFIEYQKLKQETLDNPRGNVLNVFTDGSHRKDTKQSGSAAIIYRKDTNAHTLQAHTGQETNNYAELNAILLLVEWLQTQDKVSNADVNIFTDSTYVQNRLTDPMTPRQNFFLIQEIIHKATTLHVMKNLRFTLHKIPAHLDEKSMNTCVIPESTAADAAAKAARDKAENFTSINNTREQTFYLCADLLMKISNLLTTKHRGSSSDREDRHSLSAIANRPDLSDFENHQPLA